MAEARIAPARGTVPPGATVAGLERTFEALAHSGEAELFGQRVVWGADSLGRLGELAREAGGRRVLLVTDPGVAAAGHAGRAVASLTGAGLEVESFHGVAENPTTAHVEAGWYHARDWKPDLVAAVGGGSAMDCAKGINLRLTQHVGLEAFRRGGQAARPMLPAIGVPTTAGTGSEAQSFALIAGESSGLKRAFGDPRLRFAAVLLDPRLLPSAPRAVAAAAGIDAVTHAVESHVSRARNPLSDRLSAEAWRLLSSALEPALDGDEDALSRMALGAFLAGAAIERSMLGAAHACANPLTARHGVVHGVAVGLMLPHVVRFNAARGDGDRTPAAGAGAAYAVLAGAAGGSAAGTAGLDTRVERLHRAVGLPSRLGQLGIPREALPELADLAAGQWTAGFNPRPVGRDELLGLYEAAY